MPDAYTHVRTALHSLALSGETVSSDTAFRMGANGPDPFFVYQFWRRTPAPDMAGIATRMHTEKAGACMLYLARTASSPIQKSYTAGFVMHNTLDSLAHPYIAYITQPGQLYDRIEGHCIYETALDCMLCREDTGLPYVSRPYTAPVLITNELGEIAVLLQKSMNAVYDAGVEFYPVMATFMHFRVSRFFSRSSLGFKKLAAKGVERILGKPYFLISHMLPARQIKDEPQDWVNPYTNEKFSGGMKAILRQAEDLGAARISALFRYWNGEIGETALSEAIGSASYQTGLPC